MSALQKKGTLTLDYVALLSIFGPICHPKTIENYFNVMILVKKICSCLFPKLNLKAHIVIAKSLINLKMLT